MTNKERDTLKQRLHAEAKAKHHDEGSIEIDDYDPEAVDK